MGIIYFYNIIPMKKLLIGIILGSLLLTACGKGGGDEKQRFIDASVEVACMVFTSEDAFDPSVDWEAKTKEVFAKYDFDVEDDDAMNAIAAKYQNDEEVNKALEEAMKECAGDLLGGLEGLGDLEGLELEGDDAAPVEGGEDAAAADGGETPAE